jgi:hypothetical protein
MPSMKLYTVYKIRQILTYKDRNQTPGACGRDKRTPQERALES